MKQIETFEMACAEMGYDPLTVLPDYSKTPEHLRSGMIAHDKLVIWTEALNKGHEGDSIYFPVFYKGSPSGSGFAFLDYYRWDTCSNVVARLCFVNPDLVRQAVAIPEFFELCKVYHVPGYVPENK
jgi:hypothetical protein